MKVEYQCWRDHKTTSEIEIPNIEGLKSFEVSYDVVVFESLSAGSDFSVEGNIV